MATLAGNTIASTYPLLLKIDSSGIDATLRAVEDGDATDSALLLATNKVEVKPGSNDANAFEVSQADGTAVFTVDSSSPAVSITGTLAVSDNITATSSTSLKPVLKLDNTNTDANPSSLVFDKSSTGTNEDILGRIDFTGQDTGNGETTFARIDGLIQKANATAESGKLEFQVAVDNTMTEFMRILGGSGAGGASEVIFNEDSGDHDFRVESNGNSHMLFVDAGNNRVGIGDSSPSQTLSIDVNSSTTTSAAANGIEIGNSNTTGDNMAKLGFSFGSGMGSMACVAGKFDDRSGGSETVDLIFGTIGAGSYGERMVIKGDGKIGVGTDSPGYLTELRVNDTTIDAPRLVIRQLGAGDASLAFQVPDSPNGWVMGCDQSSDECFVLGTGVGILASAKKLQVNTNGFVAINDNDSGSAGSGLKQLSLGASSSTIVDFTNIATMTGAVVSNSHNDQNTGTAVVFTHRSGSSGISYICSRNEGSDASSLHFGTRGSGGVEEEFRIDKDGNLTATDTSIGSLSDERMKEEIADYTGGLDIIKNLKPRTFKWKENTKAHKAGKTEIRRGFIAQEILEADDYYVREQEMQENETGYEYIKDTGKMYTAKLNDKDAMYISAIQSLLKRIETLENA